MAGPSPFDLSSALGYLTEQEKIRYIEKSSIISVCDSQSVPENLFSPMRQWALELLLKIHSMKYTSA